MPNLKKAIQLNNGLVFFLIKKRKREKEKEEARSIEIITLVRVQEC